MKIRHLFLATATTLCIMTAPATAATMYGGFEFEDEDFADALVADTFVLGDRVASPYDDPLDALGAPDYDTTVSATVATGSVALGNPLTAGSPLGSITVQFTDNSLTTSGDDTPDLFVFETGTVIEDFLVEISKDLISWISLGVVDGQPIALDIDDVIGVNEGDLFSYVRVTDARSGPSTGSPFGGPDIDAIGAISSGDAVVISPVPLPASALLLLGGLGLLASKRRKS